MTSDAVTEQELQEMRALQVALLLQIDQLETSLRRVRWWTLTLALLLLSLSIIVWKLV